MAKGSKVFLADGADPEMEAAQAKARETFRYFWREVAWERRRIVPGLDLAAIKAPFSDPAGKKRKSDAPQVEHMWVDEVGFDGRVVTGVLLNEPNWLKSVSAGDEVSLPLEQLGDWMYALEGEVYGAYTVNLLRARMSEAERAQHDEAWGLSFGDPTKARLVPAWKKGAAARPDDEHPMSENMGPSFATQLKADPSMARTPDEDGWTLLHHQALAGSAATVKALLEAGADRAARTADGRTALDLARGLGWERVIALLS